MPMLNYFLCLVLIVSVNCSGERIDYRRGNLILLNDHLEKEDEYEILYEGANHSEYLIFQYDGVSNWFHIITKLYIWSSVEVTLHSDDDEFKMKIADTIAELSPNSTSHEHYSLYERLQDIWKDINDVIQQCLDALSHFVFYHDDKSVELNPIGQHFVRVRYYGATPSTTTFSVTVNDTFDWKFLFYFLTGVAMLTFIHPISRKVNSLYFLCAIPVGIICSPYILIFMFSRLFPQILSYCVCSVGFASVTFVVYSLTHLTMEEILQLPLVYIVCGAIFIELFFLPVRKFLNISQRLLGYRKFLWAVRVGAALFLLQSTQSCEASVVLLTIIYVIHVLLLQRNKKLNSRKHKKLSSQELEYVTVTNNS